MILTTLHLHVKQQEVKDVAENKEKLAEIRKSGDTTEIRGHNVDFGNQGTQC